MGGQYGSLVGERPIAAPSATAAQQGVIGQRNPSVQHGLVNQQTPTIAQGGTAGAQAVAPVSGQGAHASGQGAHATQGALREQQAIQAGAQELEQPTRKRRQLLTGTPNVDIFETPDEVTIYADVPGSKSDELEILANDNSITLLASREDEDFEEDADLVLQERPSEFKRSITLPAVADIDAAEATHEDGTCKITLPKREDARQKRIGFQ